MRDRLTIADRPRDLDRLAAVLSRLATEGCVVAPESHRRWLLAIGVATASDAGLEAHPDWLACTLPARDRGELVTRTLFRDPAYRLHIEEMVATVCADIGRTGRWRRLEDLLAGPLAFVAPRIASLLDAGPSAYLDSWYAFDEHCWGRSGSAEVLFPLIVARLPQLADIPVFVDDDPLVSSLVSAAAAGEGLRVDASALSTCRSLSSQGVPLWVRPVVDDFAEVCLAGPVRAKENPGGRTPTPFSLGVPRLATQHSATVSASPPRVGLWATAEQHIPTLAFVGLEAGLHWPKDGTTALPAEGALRDLIAARRTLSGVPDASDEALRTLADSPLYGFLLQVLLLEALDRELGEPSLLLAAPAESSVGLHVYYRPRPAPNRTTPTSTLLLGSIDPVLSRVASGIGIEAAGVLGVGDGPWTVGLQLLDQVGVVARDGDRLALAPHVLDRLHGGGLMTGVIRRGKQLRERLHGVLEAVWIEQKGDA